MGRVASITPWPEWLEGISIVEETDCWRHAKQVHSNGYLRIHRAGRWQYAHRAMYEWWFGSIPDGLHIDHLCRNRFCVNPAHMEPVTPRENNRRGESPWAKRRRQTHCKRGHEFTPENTQVHFYGGRKTPGRRCRTCHREYENARYHARRKAEA